MNKASYYSRKFNIGFLLRNNQYCHASWGFVVVVLRSILWEDEGHPGEPPELEDQLARHTQWENTDMVSNR